MFDKLRIQNQLEILRNRWSKEPKNRMIIQLQARALKMALAKIEEKENIFGEQI